MAHTVDVHVGQRVRQRRWMLGVTQHELGARVGVAFQQIQEYETGTDQISASQMWNIASALKVPVAFFYEGLDGQVLESSEARAEILTDEKTLGLVRANCTMAAEVSNQAPAYLMMPITNRRNRPTIRAEATTQQPACRAWPEARYHSEQSRAVNELAPVSASANRISPETGNHAQTFAKYCGQLGWAVAAPRFAASRVAKNQRPCLARKRGRQMPDCALNNKIRAASAAHWPARRRRARS